MAPIVTVLDDDDRKKLPEKPNAPKWVEGPANTIFDHCEVSYGKKGDDLKKIQTNGHRFETPVGRQILKKAWSCISPVNMGKYIRA
ncbi:hypothetical protein PMIN03_013017 [Paraphaeosphaeria minitans]